MRVTTNAFNNNFLNSYNSLLSQYLKTENRVLTQRKFNRASEDSSGAAKAAHIRKSLDNLDIYDENLKTAKDLYYAAEDALYDVANKTYLDIKEKIVSVQDTLNQDQLDTIALELEKYAEHIVTDMNTDFATRQMFGSCSNDKTPFTVYDKVEIYSGGSLVSTFGGKETPDPSRTEIIYSETKLDSVDSKVVCFNDLPVSMNDTELRALPQPMTVRYYKEDGTYSEKNVEYTIPADAKEADCFPGTTPIYVDIGIGIKYNSDGTVVPSTALDMGLNGAEITGSGTDKDGDSKNLIQLVYDTAKALRSGDVESVNKYIDKIDDANSKVLDAITALGVKQNNMQMYLDRNDVYRLNLKEKQNNVEYVDIEEEITNMKTIEAAYNASLSMGGSILPKSLFDFV